MKKLVLLLLPFIIGIFSTQLYAQTVTNKFPDDGNVGIGTTNPHSWFGGKTVEIFDGRPVLKLKSNGALSTITFTHSLIGSSHDGEFHINHDFDNDDYNNSKLRFSTYPGGEILSMLASGNIGIGTTNPQAKLHVSYSDSGNDPINISAGLFIENAGSDNSYYVFQTATQGGGKSFSITNAGNIGIGTSTPDYKLDVLGTIRAHEIKVQTTGADFVFKSDYNLPTLHEVENYINQNGHLPDIPSAEEVEENGISLGEMNALLLQKIEELTLYTLEQEKKLEVKSSQLEAQQNELKKQNELLGELLQRIEKLEEK